MKYDVQEWVMWRYVMRCDDMNMVIASIRSHGWAACEPISTRPNNEYSQSAIDVWNMMWKNEWFEEMWRFEYGHCLYH